MINLGFDAIKVKCDYCGQSHNITSDEVADVFYDPNNLEEVQSYLTDYKGLVFGIDIDSIFCDPTCKLQSHVETCDEFKKFQADGAEQNDQLFSQ